MELGSLEANILDELLRKRQELNKTIEAEADAFEEEQTLADNEAFIAEFEADSNSEVNQTAVTNINNVLRNVPGFNTGA